MDNEKPYDTVKESYIDSLDIKLDSCVLHSYCSYTSCDKCPYSILDEQTENLMYMCGVFQQLHEKYSLTNYPYSWDNSTIEKTNGAYINIGIKKLQDYCSKQSLCIQCPLSKVIKKCHKYFDKIPEKWSLEDENNG